MQDHIYKVIELVGSSETSIEDAISSAITRANETIRHLRWFEVVQTRGHVENGKISHYQVTLRSASPWRSRTELRADVAAAPCPRQAPASLRT